MAPGVFVYMQPLQFLKTLKKMCYHDGQRWDREFSGLRAERNFLYYHTKCWLHLSGSSPLFFLPKGKETSQAVSEGEYILR